MTQGKRKPKHKLDQSCETFLGKWVGGTNPLSLPSNLKVAAANYGGKLKPWGESGHTISENRLGPSMELLRGKHADMILIVEAHANDPVASQVEEHGRMYNYFAIVAPTSTNTAKAIDEFGDASKRTPSAGVAALLSPELAKRVRGPAQKLASGRVLHFILGDGESPAQDKFPTHVVVAYGLSGESSRSGARAALAKNVAKELTTILKNPAYKEHRFLVYADANSVNSPRDRTSGKMNEADHTPYSIARILNTNELIDTMDTAYEGDPPMTYFEAGKQPTSRIDLLAQESPLFLFLKLFRISLK